MGYACPVCETPQRDGEHLANHLAFTAMLHGDAHETWLDEHVPDWSEAGAADLAPVVVDYADEVAYEEVFEDTVEGRTTDHAHDHSSVASPFDAGDLDADAQRALTEAREMTRAMLADEGDDHADDDNKA